MALGNSTGTGIKVKFGIMVELTNYRFKWFALAIGVSFGNYIPAAQCQAAATHLSGGFNDRHLELRIPQQIRRTQAGYTGPQNNDMPSPANVVIDLRRAGSSIYR
jgi:hypothetical protein